MKWAIIKEYGNYAISDTGKIRNLNTGKLLKYQRSERGGYYPFVNLYKGGNRKNKTVHGLVAEAFIGHRPSGHHIHHKDADITNPSASNLEYVTAKENMRLKSQQQTRGYMDIISKGE